MNNIRFLDWLGSAALTIALLSALLLFVPGLVRADVLELSFQDGGLVVPTFAGQGASHSIQWAV
ncbi:MAG: hypothetical protein SV765_07370 [Pseudomonadota bacterium]|nr:hypothetical protein [Pseudomonadales bacterium]MDY6920016.1 hypothetical protein [Pseudomonadota bacterium]